MVFQDKEHAQKINELFVAVKIVKNKGNYKELRELYHMRGFPTVIVLAPDGSERDRIVGFANNPDKYMQKLTDYAHNRNTLSMLQKKYRQDSMDVEITFKLAEKYMDRFEAKNAQPYFRRVIKLTDDPGDKYAQQACYQIATYQARNHQNDAPLLELIPQLDREKKSDAYVTLARSHNAQADTQKTFYYYEKALKELPRDAGLMNAYAWTVFEYKYHKKYDRAIQVAEKAVKLDPDNSSIWDTLGWLYYANGDTTEAIRAMQQAFDLDPDNEYYRDNLQTFKKQ
ncbi:MAG: tetratricopeptide repeat protein [candidate division KSB1 bacterium]|nr:tetratricopeptide repeat protein [candidate division KSB1 bacterium]